MTEPASPPEGADTALPEGLTPWNASEYVPLPPATTWTYVGHNIRLTFTTDQYADVVVLMSFGDPADAPHMVMQVDLDYDAQLELHSVVFAPLLERLKKIDALTAAAEAAMKAEAERRQQEADAYAALASFQKQTQSVDGYTTHWRLHKRSCTVAAGASYKQVAEPLSYDDLVTAELPAVHAEYERLLSEKAIRHNAGLRRKQYRGQRLDRTVLTLCGRCKPLGMRSREVQDELYRLANLTHHEEDAMVKVVRLLLEIEQAAKRIDDEYQASLMDLGPDPDGR